MFAGNTILFLCILCVLYLHCCWLYTSALLNYEAFNFSRIHLLKKTFNLSKISIFSEIFNGLIYAWTREKYETLPSIFETQTIQIPRQFTGRPGVVLGRTGRIALPVFPSPGAVHLPWTPARRARASEPKPYLVWRAKYLKFVLTTSSAKV